MENQTKEITIEKHKKQKCYLEDCKQKTVKIIGYCRWCDFLYCGKHRLPEAHACKDLQGCRDKSLEKFSARLLAEKTVAEKV
jgi:predicted nucleic acid binding AN1-type Zn finger protein